MAAAINDDSGSIEVYDDETGALLALGRYGAVGCEGVSFFLSPFASSSGQLSFDGPCRLTLPSLCSFFLPPPLRALSLSAQRRFPPPLSILLPPSSNPAPPQTRPA